MRKIKGLRWYMIALVTLGTVLGYLTRNTVAAAAPTLMFIPTQTIISVILCAGITQHHIPADKIL